MVLPVSTWLSIARGRASASASDSALLPLGKLAAGLSLGLHAIPAPNSAEENYTPRDAWGESGQGDSEPDVAE